MTGSVVDADCVSIVQGFGKKLAWIICVCAYNERDWFSNMVLIGSFNENRALSHAVVDSKKIIEIHS